jgi:putative ATPase
MRPRTFDEFVGQEELLAPGQAAARGDRARPLQSIILWGPPGPARPRSPDHRRTHAREFVSFSAVLAGIKEIRDVMAEAERRRADRPPTIVFIDEIHRFNKASRTRFCRASRPATSS